jgi:uncharacterized protein
MDRIIRTARLLMIWPIKLYQYLLSPYIGSCCRFYPTCSNYALEAVNRYGVIKGAYLAIKRMMRCHPWSAGGYDPVSSTYSDFN